MGCDENCNCQSDDKPEMEETTLAVDPYGPPLSVTLVGLDGARYYLTGRRDSPVPDLTGLTTVEKAALKVLLQEALRLLDPAPHRFAGGIIPAGGTITINNP